MAGFFRDLTDALGFTKTKVPASALPQVDQLKAGAGRKVGQYLGEQADALGQINNYNYLNPRKASPVQATQYSLPGATNEAGRQIFSVPAPGSSSTRTTTSTTGQIGAYNPGSPGGYTPTPTYQASPVGGSSVPWQNTNGATFQQNLRNNGYDITGGNSNEGYSVIKDGFHQIVKPGQIPQAKPTYQYLTSPATGKDASGNAISPELASQKMNEFFDTGVTPEMKQKMVEADLEWERTHPGYKSKYSQSAKQVGGTSATDLVRAYEISNQPGQGGEVGQITQQGQAVQGQGATGPAYPQEAGRAIPTISTESSQNVNLQPSSDLYNLGAERLKNLVLPQITGYDPEMKDIATEQLNEALTTQQNEALNAAKEQMSQAGVLNSTMGAGTLGQIAAKIAAARAQGLADINTKDLEAQREDRYRNAQLAGENAGQLAQLGQAGQALALNAEEFKRTGRQIDQDTAMKLAEFQRTGQQIDSDTAMKVAAFAREGGQIDLANAWQQYAAKTSEAQRTAEESRRVQDQNIAAEDTGATREQQMQQDLIRAIMNYANGDPYTPESLVNAQRYQMEKGAQASNLGNLTKLLTAGIF